MVVWITGLAGAGKTEIGMNLYKKLKDKYINTILLDGDLFREVLGKSEYSREGRLEVARRISKFCALIEKQNINVVCCTISLFKEIHELNRKIIQDYYEIYIDVDFAELVRRDKKNLYSNAVEGIIKNVVGVDIPFDKPQHPHLVIDNTALDKLEKKAERIFNLLEKIREG